jgi:hypothetical protein
MLVMNKMLKGMVTHPKPLFNNIHLVKPCVSTFDTTPTFVFGVVISQGGYELGAMPSALNGGVQGQMLGLMNNVLSTNLGNLCCGIQVGGFLNLNIMGQWNPSCNFNIMQTWHTLA